MSSSRATDVALYLGETLGFWLHTGAVFLSAMATAGLCLYAARQLRLLRIQSDRNEVQARRRATVDVVINENRDAELKAARAVFAGMHEDQVNFTPFACRDLVDHAEQNRTILAVLNQYEFIAAGIREGAFDEGVYKRMKRSLLIRDWDALAPYVVELRRQSRRNRLFAEMEWLANRWRDEPVTDPPHGGACCQSV